MGVFGGPRGVRQGVQKRAKNGQKRPKKGVFWGNTFLTRFFRFSRVEHPREFSCVFGGKTPGKSPCQILCQNYTEKYISKKGRAPPETPPRAPPRPAGYSRPKFQKHVTQSHPFQCALAVQASYYTINETTDERGTMNLVSGIKSN